MLQIRLIAIALILIGLSSRLVAAQPAWWTDDFWGTNILQPDGIADNYAPANLGQLKWVATQAQRHLDFELALAGYSGVAIDDLVDSFTPEGGHTSASRAANYAPTNLGQLKAVAKVFYDRLITVGYNTRQNLIDHGYPADWPHNYPWDPSAPQNLPGSGDKSINYAPANLGQLKMVFSFDLTKDANEDFVPDWWQAAYPHDSFEQASNLAAQSGLVRGINSFATTQYGEPYHAGGYGERSLWFRWQPSVTGRALFETAGSGFDTVLSVYTGSTLLSLSLVATNDDAGPRTTTSRVSFQAQAGVTYWIALAGYESDPAGEYALRWAGWSDTDFDQLPDSFELEHGLIIGFNDAALDKDSDGLTNFQEYQLGTKPNNYDSDGDLLSDEYEVRWGLNPLISTGVHGQDGDYDGDGLTNFQEQTHNTNPRDGDTDDDSVGDQQEVNQGSRANNSSDGGQPPPEGAVVEITFLVGDLEYSKSERWKMVIKGTDPEKDDQEFSLQSPEAFGEPATEPYKLRRGAPYEITLHHLGTDPAFEFPEDYPGTADYDWDATVNGLPTTDVLQPGAGGSFFVVGGAWLVANRQGLLGAQDGGYLEPTNHAAGKKAYLLPFELNSDLNNDGKAGEGVDSGLKTAGAEDSASEDAKEKATEYLFVNDQLSNGIGDKEDGNKPPGTTDDDDLTELKTICAATWGGIWFEFEGGDISKLEFWKNKECTDAFTFSPTFALSESNKLPEKLYVRTKGDWTAQVEGKLVMKFGKADKSETYASDKLRFTVVKEVGNTKYFHAARDYMLEQNARLHVRYFKSGSHEIRITAMRHEATDMKVIETYHRNPKIYGMPDVVAKSQDYYDLLVNGNFCYFGDGGFIDQQIGRASHGMTDRCHGGCVVGGARSPATSVGGTHAFEQANAEYFSASGKGTFAITTGVVPLNPIVHQAALGGFASNLVGGTYNTHPWFGLAEIGPAGDKKKLIFTVTQTAATTQYPLADLVARLTASGQTLCVAGDGGTSTACAHRVEGDTTKVKFAGSKHYPDHYWINTYVGFKSDKPRP